MRLYDLIHAAFLHDNAITASSDLEEYGGILHTPDTARSFVLGKVFPQISKNLSVEHTDLDRLCRFIFAIEVAEKLDLGPTDKDLRLSEHHEYLADSKIIDALKECLNRELDPPFVYTLMAKMYRKFPNFCNGLCPLKAKP